MKVGVSKVVLVLLVLTLIVISGCSLWPGSKRDYCSEGRACNYFTGNEGVRMYLERPQNTLYFHSQDLGGDPDANSVEFNVRLENIGASYAYGATFIEGFDPNLFKIYKLDNGQYVPINIPRAGGTCFFDLLGFGQNGYLGFAASCAGIGGTVFSPGGNWGVNLNFQQIGIDIFGDYGWPDLNLNFNRQSGDQFTLGIGYDGNLFNVLAYGQYLMGIMQGYDFENYGGSTFALRGDNPDFPGGDVDYKSFKVQLWQPWPSGNDYARVPYQIKSCYGYTTFVSPMVCVDPNPYSEEDKVCTDYTYSWGGSQGAPVAVTRLEQINTGNEVLLDITIRNVGRGTVWDAGKLYGCSPYYPEKVTSNMHNVVYIGPAYIGNTQIDCSRYNSVRLDPQTQEARFTCRYDFREGAADIGSGYATPLKMELWYGYEEIVENSIMIRRVG